MSTDTPDAVLPPAEASTSVVQTSTTSEAAATAPLEGEASTFLAQGIKHLALRKFGEAAESLARAIELLAEKHGELVPELAEPHMLYGKALLEHAVEKSDVLGSAPTETKPDQAGPSTSKNGAAAEPVTAQNISFHFGGDGPDEEVDEEEEGGEAAEAAEGEDEDDDLELAFQSLDTARLILLKHPTLSRFQLAEVHRLLGQVLSESEQFPDAYKEYESSLEVLQEIVEGDDRRLSELYLLLALNSEFVPGKESEAVGWAEKAKKVLVKRQITVEALGEEGKKELDDEIGRAHV